MWKINFVGVPVLLRTDITRELYRPDLSANVPVYDLQCMMIILLLLRAASSRLIIIDLLNARAFNTQSRRSIQYSSSSSIVIIIIAIANALFCIGRPAVIYNIISYRYDIILYAVHRDLEALHCRDQSSSRL